MIHCYIFSFFFFNDTATTEIYTLSLHDALPICLHGELGEQAVLDHLARAAAALFGRLEDQVHRADRKSTRLNSSHGYISYAVFCLKKKKKTNLMSDCSVSYQFIDTTV